MPFIPTTYTCNMYAIMSTKGDFLNINNVFDHVFSGIKLFHNVEEAEQHIIFYDEHVVKVNIDLSTISIIHKNTSKD